MSKDKPPKTIKGRIPLSAAARKQIRDLAHTGKSVVDIAKITGYNSFDIKAIFLQNQDLKKRVSPGRKIKRKRMEPPNKPQFVAEVEKTTGLKCIFLRNSEHDSEWVVLSPKKVPLFTIFGRGDLIGGTTAIKKDSLQGITYHERSLRMERRRMARMPSMLAKSTPSPGQEIH